MLQKLKQLSQTRSTNPFRPGSGILPPLLAGRERETAIFEARVARTRERQPQHTALLGEWAIGKTTLLMHWRRMHQRAGDAVVLSMAYPQSADDFLAGLVSAIEAELATDWPERLDVELGVGIGIANARIRRPSRDPERELRAALRWLVEHHRQEGRSVIVMLDDVDLLPITGDVLLRLRACALELYAADLPFAFLIAASSGVFDAVRSAHEPLVRFFEPLSLGPLDHADATQALLGPRAGGLGSAIPSHHFGARCLEMSNRRIDASIGAITVTCTLESCLNATRRQSSPRTRGARSWISSSGPRRSERAFLLASV